GALLDADVLLNAKQLNIWMTDEEQAPAKESEPNPAVVAKATAPLANGANTARSHAEADAPGQPDPKPASAPVTPAPLLPPPPARDSPPEALAELQSSIQGSSNHMQK